MDGMSQRHRNMLADAILTRDPNLLKAIQGQIQTEQGVGQYDYKPAGNGQIWKINTANPNEPPTLISGAGATPQGDQIIPPPNPKDSPERQQEIRDLRRSKGIPDDNRTWRVRPGERGNQLEALDEREAKDFDRIQTLSGKLESNETVKTYRKMTDAVGSLEAAFSQQNAAGDVNGLVQVFKAIDPNSTVSATESGQITASGGADAWLQNWANKINQSGMMTPQMRADFMNAARDQLRARNSQASTLVEGTRRQAKLAGLDQDAATGYFQDSKIFNKPRYTADDFGARSPDTQAGLRPGDVVQDKVYIGGPASDPRSWRDAL